MKYSVKIRKNKRYLNEFVHKVRLYFAKILFERKVKEKTLTILEWFFDVIVTGVAIHYIINHKNILSYGLTVFIVQYYIMWFVNLVRDRKVKVL